jgi:hypothetical protein
MHIDFMIDGSAIQMARQGIKVIYLPVTREDGKYEKNIKRLLVHEGPFVDDVCRRTILLSQLNFQKDCKH